MKKHTQLMLGLIATVALGALVVVNHNAISGAHTQPPVGNSISKPHSSWISETFRWAAERQEENRRKQALLLQQQAVPAPTATASKTNQPQPTKTRP